MMLARKRQRFVRPFTPVTGAVVGVLACLLIAVSAAPASASWGIHKSFSPLAGEEPDFHEPVGVAVDEAGSGHVEAGSIYVGSIFSGLSGFNLADELVSPSSFFGGYAEMSGVAVNPVNHNVYAVNASEQKLETFDPSTGAQVASFEIPGTVNLILFGGVFKFTAVQIASDAHGNVYVPDAPENKVEVFDETGGEPEGGVAKEIGVGTLSEPEGVAIDAAGNVWVADTGAGKIEEFSPTGTLIKEIASPQAQSVALDGSGDVFALIGAAEPYVIEYNPAGTAVLAEFGKGVLALEAFGVLPDGIAVDRAREIVYVADNGNNRVDVFVSWGLTTEPPSNVAEGQATLHGTVGVEPGSSVATCKFEYGLTTAYGSSVPCAPPGPYTANTPVSATLSGLNAGVDYHYRISATNAGGFTQVGEDRTFGPPAIASESAEAIVTTATLRARLTVVEAGGSSCKEAQYVPEAEYAVSGFTHAQSLPCIPPIGSTPGEYDVETEEMEGLQADTVYHYRFITESHAGTQVGPDMEFATFGIVPGSFSFAALGEAEEPFTQAGGHPYEETDTFRLNTSTKQGNPLATDGNPRNVVTELPPGLIGNPNATPKCEPYNIVHGSCSRATQVGTMVLYTSNPGHVEATGEPEKYFEPIYNLVPPKGLAAQFGLPLSAYGVVHIDVRVRTGGDYGVTAEVIDGSAGEGLVAAEVTLWGVPAAVNHGGGPLIPFLSNPTACAGEREARMTVEPWQQDEPAVLVPASARMPAITGCGRLKFEPGLEAQPTTSVADSPTGLRVDVHVPQPEQCNEEPGGKVECGLAEADLKNARVTLPAGVTVNPSSANGLLGCPMLTGKGSHAGESGIDLENGEPANCPNASKVGNVTIETPLLEHPLTGGVYVAQQNANPFKSLLALYIAAENEERGVVVKLAGKVSLDAVTGQLTTTFDENPQLPFENLKLSFFGGERAALATPRACGSYQPTALLEAFSHQGAPGEEGTPNAEPYIHPFQITSGPGGSACAPPPFAPSFEAGSANSQAGAFGAFVVTLARKDGEQRFSTLATTMPPGLAGILAKVALCGEAQANAGTCPAASKIGHVTVTAGVGSDPITLPQAGKAQDPVYLTGPYDGAPFGLSIVVPAEAGPFNLDENGHPVVVRARVEVDRHTAQVSVLSGPMPQTLQSIPVDVRTINVTIDRPEFTFNPTNCEPLTVAGAISSAEGATATVSSPFEAANCAALPFKPKFTVSTQGKASKASGASLHVKVTSGPGQANIAKVKVNLPIQLPSRLSTLQKACVDAVFKANPASCPTASAVGRATAVTPVLAHPLTGPAFLVSHAGAAFPDLEVVLQGEGITLILDGNTQIKKGITSSTFRAVPDAPISSFDMVLPEGPHSVLATNLSGKAKQNLCGQRLNMPTVITGQNGAIIRQTTKIAVTGCPKVKAKKVTKRHKAKKGHKAKGSAKRGRSVS
jgi:DNA-binding beta-propeller fold protein YncE